MTDIQDSARRSATELKPITWWAALLEIVAALVVLILCISLLGIGTGVIWLGPLGTPITLLVISPLLWRRGERWTTLGLRKNGSLKQTIVWGVLLSVAALVVLISVTALIGFFVPESSRSVDQSVLGDVRGNLWIYLYFVAVIAWLSQGLGEELLFRGFIQARFEQMFGRRRRSRTFAVLPQAILFGMLHSYQGLAGMIATGCVGLIFGIACLLLRRSLWPLILAHAICGAVLISWEFFR